MIPKTLNFKPQYEGDTFNGWQFTITDGDNLPIDLTNVSILMQIKGRNGGTVYKNFEIGSGITLVNALNGVFRLDSFKNISVGNYVFDIQITYENGVIKTYIKGSYNVELDTSN
jgi:hypothetical protein